MSNELLLIAAAAFLLAGTVKGMIGIGLPTITISILAQFVDPRVAIALLLLPALVTNGWQIYRGGQIKRSFSKLWPYVITMMITMYIAALYAAEAPADLLITGIGVAVVLWTLTSLIKEPPMIPDRLDPIIQPIAGVFAGILGGLAAIWSPSMVVYLLARRVDKDDFVRFTGFIIITGTVPLTLGYLTTGLLNAELAVISALLIVPTLLGFSIGERLRGRLNGKQFHNFLLVVFCFMGLNLIWRGVT